MKLLRFSNSSCCNLTFWASDNYPDSYLDSDQWHGTRSPIEAWCQQFWPIFRHLQIFISHNCTKTLGWPSRVIETFWKVAMNSMHTCMIWSKELLNISQMKVVTLWELSVLWTENFSNRTHTKEMQMQARFSNMEWGLEALEPN